MTEEKIPMKEVQLNIPTSKANTNIRDPKRINDDIKVHFEDIFGEADKEIFSFKQIWGLSDKVFTMTKLWCYRITSLILALPLAVCWGLCFACVAFTRVWLCMPCVRCCDTEMVCVRKVWQITIDSIYRPFYEAMGSCLSFIHVYHNNGPEKGRVQQTNDEQNEKN